MKALDSGCVLVIACLLSPAVKLVHQMNVEVQTLPSPVKRPAVKMVNFVLKCSISALLHPVIVMKALVYGCARVIAYQPSAVNRISPHRLVVPAVQSHVLTEASATSRFNPCVGLLTCPVYVCLYLKSLSVTGIMHQYVVVTTSLITTNVLLM